MVSVNVLHNSLQTGNCHYNVQDTSITIRNEEYLLEILKLRLEEIHDNVFKIF